ncbi:hypothetical protein KR50_34540 [Jeotgalibacillus campisalis]|uniref:Uncharacterized protein n=1 Tax=Jeotgalibacillus campisalis TaxID=220754 RepID=A0A0C2VEW3_9BACL|nr:hypothetical protein KR50_34540 [Jeotgalibacillus campisalis]
MRSINVAHLPPRKKASAWNGNEPVFFLMNLGLKITFATLIINLMDDFLKKV